MAAKQTVYGVFWDAASCEIGQDTARSGCNPLAGWPSL